MVSASACHAEDVSSILITYSIFRFSSVGRASTTIRHWWEVRGSNPLIGTNLGVPEWFNG